ncbi:MAG: hypothetical protein K1X28_01065 [Parachlamydiales bacterium]|nr:hypothetical protein [Parachlamydiales bacterium]
MHRVLGALHYCIPNQVESKRRYSIGIANSQHGNAQIALVRATGEFLQECRSPWFPRSA